MRVTDWRLGETALPDKPIAAMPLQLTQSPALEQAFGRQIHGLLGSDVLSAYGIVALDYERGTLRLGATEADTAVRPPGTE